MKIKVVALLLSFLLVQLSAVFSLDEKIIESPPVKSDSIDGFEFIDKDVTEILYTVSMYRGIAISCDDTVSGRMSFRFAGTSFENAFDSFLKANRLYVTKKDGAWVVSRFKFKEENGIFFADAFDMKPSLIAEKLGEYFGCTVTYSQLGSNPVSLHVQINTSSKRYAAQKILEALVRQTGAEYVLDLPSADSEDSIVFHIRRELNNGKAGTVSGRIVIEANRDDKNLFDVDIQNAAVGDSLEELFSKAKKEFVFSCDTQSFVKRLKFNRKDFNECLELICASCNLDCTECDGICYVVPLLEKTNYVQDAGKVWKKHKFNYYSCTKAQNLLLQRFGQIPFIILEADNSILYFAKNKTHELIDEFSSSFDIKQNVKRIELRYIKTSDFLSALPPSVEQGQIVKSSRDNEFFFTGTDEQYEKLLEDIKTIDVSAKRIRYDLLVMQFQSTDDFSFDSSLSMRRLELGDRNGIAASLGSVLDLNLDVVGAFGLKFASSLQTAINENRARVFADTTLHGVNGGTINFKNTNTYRYRDNNLDPETGKPVYSGVTREIASGLTIDITGWVSGDGMITSKVTASVSRQGADLSSKTGNPPPTSEKTITTEVLGKSGEPVVLSGLLQNEQSLVEERMPFVSKIPILGWFFKSYKQTKENTEMVIYLVPHWEMDKELENNKNCISSSFDEDEFCDSILRSRVLNSYK